MENPIEFQLEMSTLEFTKTQINEGSTMAATISYDSLFSAPSGDAFESMETAQQNTQGIMHGDVTFGDFYDKRENICPSDSFNSDDKRTFDPQTLIADENHGLFSKTEVFDDKIYEITLKSYSLSDEQDDSKAPPIITYSSLFSEGDNDLFDISLEAQLRREELARLNTNHWQEQASKFSGMTT